MRAISYSPVPYGEDPSYAEPYGDYFTDAFSGIFDRDLDLFERMGANTVRLYARCILRELGKSDDFEEWVKDVVEKGKDAMGSFPGVGEMFGHLLKMVKAGEQWRETLRQAGVLRSGRADWARKWMLYSGRCDPSGQNTCCGSRPCL